MRLMFAFLCLLMNAPSVSLTQDVLLSGSVKEKRSNAPISAALVELKKSDGTLLDTVRTDGYGNWSYLFQSSAVGPEPSLPQSFALHQNYPNPFNPSTQIRFSVPSREIVSLRVFDVLGREVTVLVREMLEAGSYVAKFNAANLPSGVYIYTLAAGDYRMSQKMLLLK